jgi:hypothetical protein
MSPPIERRQNDVEIAVLKEQVAQLTTRCDKKDHAIEALMAFQNKAIGYSMAASAVVAYAVQYLAKAG